MVKYQEAFVTINEDSMIVKVDYTCETIVCRTSEEAINVLESVEDLFCSSTVSFPRESTSEQWIIDICEALMPH